MKTSAAVALIIATLGFSSMAAENNQTSTSAGPAGAAAMRQAADAKQYLFAFFYEKDDQATKSARQTFDAALKKINPAPKAVAIDRTATGEKEIVDKFGVDRAPMPMVLAIAPNGAVTGGIKGADVNEARLQDAIASAGMQQCLKALQDRKLVFVCLQNPKTKANDAALKGVNEFKADPQFVEATEIIKVDPADPKESKLLAQLKADPKAKTASTAFLAPPGMVVSKLDGATTKADWDAALKKAVASCASASEESSATAVAPFTTCARAALVAEVYSAPPAYDAVIACAPQARLDAS